MLSVYDRGQKYPITDQTDFYITHVDGGEDTLDFTVAVDTEIYKHLAEENQIEYGNNLYLIKSINAPSTYANISCVVDLDFLKASFYQTYDSGSVTLSALLASILPSGWTVAGYNPGISRTISLENATNYDVMKQAKSTYSVAFRWNSIGKFVTVINPADKTPSGEYLTDELNLRSIAYKGESTDFITRLYPYGKDGMTIASVNDGLEYIDNHQYSNKIVCGYWSDDRYTVPESLKTDAIERLTSLSVPARSYDCDVIDLAKLDDRYSLFDFAMYKIVTLIDRRRGLRLDHQILEYKEYPDQPQKNVLTLSSVVSTVQDNIGKAQDTADEANDGVRKVGIRIDETEIELTGKVSFQDLSTDGRTTIVGGNITAGKIQSESGAVYLDLDNDKAAVTEIVSPGTDYSVIVGSYSSSQKGLVLMYDGDPYGYIVNNSTGGDPSGLALKTSGSLLSIESSNAVHIGPNGSGSALISCAQTFCSLQSGSTGITVRSDGTVTISGSFYIGSQALSLKTLTFTDGSGNSKTIRYLGY